MEEPEIFCAGENSLEPESEFRKLNGNWVHKTVRPEHWANTGLPVDDPHHPDDGPAPYFMPGSGLHDIPPELVAYTKKLEEPEIFCAGENSLFPESEFRKQGGNWVHKTAHPEHWASTGLPPAPFFVPSSGAVLHDIPPELERYVEKMEKAEKDGGNSV